MYFDVLLRTLTYWKGNEKEGLKQKTNETKDKETKDKETKDKRNERQTKRKRRFETNF